MRRSEFAGRWAVSRWTNRLVARLLAIPPRVTDMLLAAGLMVLAINVGASFQQDR